MTVLLWIICLIVLTALTIVACALTLGSDADDIADATLERLNGCEDD
jgi:hypothetical protein